MRVAFVQTYPLYHDLLAREQWLALANRDRWMPGLLAGLGHDVELWVGDRGAGACVSELPGFGTYPIRFFPAQGGPRTKFHRSGALVAHARAFAPDLCILKGIDGGIGEYLIRTCLEPEGRPYAFVIGGKPYSRYVPAARFVFYETAGQRDLLLQPGWRRWRRPVPAERLIRLPKSVDTDRFRPMPEAVKRWDVIAVGRLVPRVKNYDALGQLAREMRVAVVGGGPDEAMLRRRYPEVEWLGAMPNHQLPLLLNQARVFMHPSAREFYPRVLAEAMACGLPCVAFADAIAADVLPAACGLRVGRADYATRVRALLHDEPRRDEMGRNSRAFAETALGKRSAEEALRTMLARLEGRHRHSTAA